MPKIGEFDAPSGVAFRPDETAPEILGRLARYHGAVGDQLGHVLGGAFNDVARTVNQLEVTAQNHQTMQEIGAGAASAAKLHDSAMDDWQSTLGNSSVNDTKVGGQFLQKYEDTLQQWEGQFTTPRAQEWALTQADNMRAHMWQTVHSDMGTRAADAAVVNATTTVNSLANTAYKDPSFYEHGVAQLQEGIEAQIAAGNLPAAAASRLRTEAFQKGKEALAKSTIMGMIDKNPEAAATELASTNRFDGVLTGSDITSMTKAAEVAQRMEVAQKKAMAAEDRMAQGQAFNTRASTIYGSLIQPDGSLAVPPDFYKNVKGLATAFPGTRDLGTLEALVNSANAITNREGKGELKQSEVATKQDFASRLSLDPSDPNHLTQSEVFNAWANNKITKADLTTFNEALKDQSSLTAVAGNPMVKTELSRADTIIQGALDGTNGAVRGQMAQFKLDTLKTLAAVVQNGGDIRPFLDPKNPEYLFTPERINQYRPTSAEMASHIMQTHVIKTEQSQDDRTKAIMSFLRSALGDLPPPGGGNK